MTRPSLWLAALLLAAGCTTSTPVGPVEPTRETACALDGMLLLEYPGPKAQIHYDQGPPDFFCDTTEMFAMVLKPEQKRRLVAVYTQDMGQADWAHPVGHWIDAKTAYYVVGSSRKGSMGATIGSFAREEDARSFARQYGGKVLRFNEVTPAMASLDGGVVRDERM